MNGGYIESRLCPKCDRDFLFPAYGTRVCHDCRWSYKARWELDNRQRKSGAPTGQPAQQHQEGEPTCRVSP